MNFTFGIITSNTVDQSVLNSIYDQNIPKFEIIVVGGHPPINHKHYRSPIPHIPFNETIKQNWITRKNNIITEWGAGIILFLVCIGALFGFVWIGTR